MPADDESQKRDYDFLQGLFKALTLSQYVHEQESVTTIFRGKRSQHRQAFNDHFLAVLLGPKKQQNHVLPALQAPLKQR